VREDVHVVVRVAAVLVGPVLGVGVGVLFALVRGRSVGFAVVAGLADDLLERAGSRVALVPKLPALGPWKVTLLPVGDPVVRGVELGLVLLKLLLIRLPIAVAILRRRDAVGSTKRTRGEAGESRRSRGASASADARDTRRERHRDGHRVSAPVRCAISDNSLAPSRETCQVRDWKTIWSRAPQ
jgi:hypothetical protein